MPVEWRPHQQEAIRKIRNGSILWGGVGSGKSLTALGYYIENESPRDIVIITTPKKRDKMEWDKEAIKLNISTDPDLSLHGGLTVDSWNNVHKYTDIEDAFFIFDEQRVVGYGQWSKSFIKIARKNRWILLSATPGDTWVDYAPVFIANDFFRNITQFRDEHVRYKRFSKYPQIEGYSGVAHLEKLRNLVLVEMPYDRHTERHVEWELCDFDKDQLDVVFKQRWNPFENEPLRDIADVFRAGRKVVATDPSRLDRIRELMVRHPKLIIFYNYDYELEILRGLSDSTTVGEWNGHRKHPIPETDRWVYLVQYTAGAEGWNCVDTDAMVFYSLTYSYKIFEQAQGRIDRLDTPFSDLYYYVLYTESQPDRAVIKAIDRKEIFNERAWMLKQK